MAGESFLTDEVMSNSGESIQRVAFLGLGLMGSSMAANLIRSGLPVCIWNRTKSKMLPLIALGAQAVDTPVEAAMGADVVITMLHNGNIVDEVLFETGVAGILNPGALVIDMSSISPLRAKRHFQKLLDMKIDYLDAPVSGGTAGAEEGALVIMVGGEKQVYDRALPILAPLGRASYIGPSGSGQLTKVANQIIVGITIGAVAEGLLLAAAGGADPTTVRDCLLGGFAESRILEQHGKRMIDRDFEPGGSNKIFLKDLNTVIATANELELDLPLLSYVHGVYKKLIEGAFSDHDHSSYILALEEENHPITLQTD